MRIRISYNKNSLIRFTSALDMQRIWERSFRRASIKVTYSKGFHPQPRIQLGIPLPLGFIGLEEKVDRRFAFFKRYFLSIRTKSTCRIRDFLYTGNKYFRKSTIIPNKIFRLPGLYAKKRFFTARSEK